jgi:lycopene epsilon-cyclase
MPSKRLPDVLVLGAGPAGMAIASALGKEKLYVEVLSPNGPDEPWPNTYGIWGKEVDQLGLQDLLEYRWKNTVSFFGHGSLEEHHYENKATEHFLDYGLFDKKKLHSYWLNECNKSHIKWHEGFAEKIHFQKNKSIVSTSDGKTYSARLVVDATGYDPVFLKLKSCGPLAVQTCYGIVGSFSKPPLKKGQFVLMDYRNDHLNEEQKKEPPTFLYAMDMGNGKYFLEETSLGLVNPLTMENLKERLEKRLSYRNISITSMQHEELGLFLPMNMPIPNFKQQILGYGGAASMVHPASGYLIGNVLRRAPLVAKAISTAMNDKKLSTYDIARKGWESLWPKELIRKKSIYQFGLEKLMRFDEKLLREFFGSFFKLPKTQWYGFLTDTLSLREIVYAMCIMFIRAPWSVKKGLMIMHGKELKMLLRIVLPNI